MFKGNPISAALHLGSQQKESEINRLGAVVIALTLQMGSAELLGIGRRRSWARNEEMEK